MSLGNEAPYNITQPSTDNDVQIVTATMATLTCSLNDTIPPTMMITWTHNNTITIPINQTSTTGNTTTLTIENPQSSDDGVYQCVFNDTAGYTLRRRIIFLSSSKSFSLCRVYINQSLCRYMKEYVKIMY